ncbi:PilZ domain-containing protein [Methylobacterium sp. E-005]|uniref:PilZ domain-containing protein n=1 Tax=Methylobacterium sp. E-005 TaxID=2836549 RepID=UPI001FBA27AF|nr:PilZ domain-containing protein [Methylobacterium sp. E-005]MCJ2086959.1 PilZ domain-containing protein [Methylobacterium sp. E-005]
MIERRTESRTYLSDVSGQILIDEHRTVPCIVSDRSVSGIRVTLPGAEDVPDAFVLTVDYTGELIVCRAAWRKVDQIGCSVDAPAAARRPTSRIWRQTALV